MYNMLELSGLFVFLGGLDKFFSAWGDRKNCLFVVCQGGSVSRLTLREKFFVHHFFEIDSIVNFLLLVNQPHQII